MNLVVSSLFQISERLCIFCLIEVPGASNTEIDRIKYSGHSVFYLLVPLLGRGKPPRKGENQKQTISYKVNQNGLI